MTIAREEIFGPVMSVLRAPDLDSAIDMINGSEYGNAVDLHVERGRGQEVPVRR